MKKLLRISLGFAVAAASLLAQAGVVYSAGALSREEGSQTIRDSLNGREWVGWDMVRKLGYARTNAAISAGGLYEGFHIANIDDVQAFVNALLPGKYCDVKGGQISFRDCASAPGGIWEKLVGESQSPPGYYVEHGRMLYGWDYDEVWYLSPSGGASIFQVATYYPGVGQALSVGHDSISISTSELYSNEHMGAIGWLLYRDIAPAAVPEPSSVSLLAAGLLGWLGMRRRIKPAADALGISRRLLRAN